MLGGNPGLAFAQIPFAGGNLLVQPGLHERKEFLLLQHLLLPGIKLGAQRPEFLLLHQLGELLLVMHPLVLQQHFPLHQRLCLGLQFLVTSLLHLLLVLQLLFELRQLLGLLLEHNLTLFQMDDQARLRRQGQVWSLMLRFWKIHIGDPFDDSRSQS